MVTATLKTTIKDKEGIQRIHIIGHIRASVILCESGVDIILSKETMQTLKRILEDFEKPDYNESTTHHGANNILKNMMTK